MKKLISALLVCILIAMILASMFAAFAEAPGSTVVTPATVDLTQVVISVVLLVFNFLLAWIIKAVIPPIRLWLEARTTNEQRTLLYNLVYTLVNAAEQVIGRGRGSEKFQYVIQVLEENGYTVDVDMIEAAVKEMDDVVEARVIEALKMPSVEVERDPKEEPGDEAEEEDSDN